MCLIQAIYQHTTDYTVWFSLINKESMIQGKKSRIHSHGTQLFVLGKTALYMNR